jgi:hypothetical protein
VAGQPIPAEREAPHAPRLVIIVGMLDTINALIQSVRYDVFNQALGVNWVIVTICVPAPLVASALILWQLVRSPGQPLGRYRRPPR